MNLKERIDELNVKYGISSYTMLLVRIYKLLGSKDPYEAADKQKSNFSQILQGKRPLNKEYYIPLERIYEGVTIDYILNGVGEPKKTFQNKGLRYVAATNDYNEFKKLGSELYSDKGAVIFNSDEYQKTIIDYIIEFKADEGIKYLINEYGLYYDSLRNFLTDTGFKMFCNNEQTKQIADILFEKDDDDSFIKLFNPFNMIRIFYEEQSIYSDKEFLHKILHTEKIFNVQLAVKQIAVKDVNMDKVFDDTQESLYINPLVNLLLNAALEDYKKYNDKIHKILDFAIVNNKDVISFLNIAIDKRNYIDGYKIDKYGNVILGTYYKYGHIVNSIEVIDPDWPLEIKQKISTLNEINNSINYSDSIDYFGENHKKTKLNKAGHILKLASKNDVEYQIYDYFKNINGPIPKYYGMHEGVDEFEKYRGQPVGRSYTIEHLKEVARFLRWLHDTTINDLPNAVFVHGDMDLNNFYFEDGKLVEVVNWDNATIGSIFDDMILLIMKYSGMADLYRVNKKVLKNVKEIFDAYDARESYRSVCVDLMKTSIERSIAILDQSEFNNDEEKIREYEGYLWCLSFVKVYANEMKKM